MITTIRIRSRYIIQIYLFQIIMRIIYQIITLLAIFGTTFASFNLSIVPYGQTYGIPIFINSILQSTFNDTIYNKQLCCQSGNLYIYQLTKKHNDYIEFVFSGNDTNLNIIIQTSKFANPLPTINSLNESSLILSTHCNDQIVDNSYYNKIDMTITQLNFNLTFHFLLDCDYGNRHKGFQVGYIFIALFDAAVMIAVSLYSKIWSYTYNRLPIGITMDFKWFIPLALILVVAAIVLGFYDYKRNQSQQIPDNIILQLTLQITGSIIAFVFLVICLNQIFFLIERLRKNVFKIIRICDILSISGAILAVVLVQVFASDFITNDLLSLAIAVGLIKLLKFKNLKQAFICCFTVFICQIAAAVAIHYVLQKQSYNDIFGRETNSPIILQFPAMQNLLYRKCSWLAISEIILPGATIAYLRRYDYSRQSKFYFIIGNFLFIASTIMWIIIESFIIRNHTIPFASVTYPLLFIPIIFIAYRRGEQKEIINGAFTDTQFFENEQQQDLFRQRNSSSINKRESDIYSSLIYENHKNGDNKLN